MLTDTLKTLFKRDLEKLIEEINLYRNEKRIWEVEGRIANSAGNLALHLIGNLNAFIGEVIGKTGYIRNRVEEFSLKNISREELIQKLKDTIVVVESALSNMQPELLTEEYPVLVFDKKTSTEYFLVHLATHLTYHLGQVNYHRRLLDN
jgi:hypothetical protein